MNEAVLNLIKHGYDRFMVNIVEIIYVNHVVNGLDHPDMKKWL